MNNTFKLTIIYADQKLSLSTTGKTTMYDIKRALAKKFDLSYSTIQFRIGDSKKKFEFPDNVLLCNSGIQSGDTITLDVMSSSLRRLNSRNLREMGHKFDQIPDQNGLIMIRRIMPADNSCLFNSVAYAMERKDKSAAKYLREIVAGYIASEPEKYNELVLERPNKDYQRWILDERNWGGAIELEILSRHYSIEICAVDIMTMNVNIFGSDQKYQKRIYVLYDGVHYDAIARNISEDMEDSMDVTIFRANDRYAFDGIMALAKELNYKAQLSLAEKYDARPDSCSKNAARSKDIREHDKKGGYYNFNEISS